MNKTQATHRSHNGKWLYRVKHHAFKCDDVEFWCSYQEKWVYSSMQESELVKFECSYLEV